MIVAPEQVLREFPYRPDRLQAALVFVATTSGAGLICYQALHPGWPIDGRGGPGTAAADRLLWPIAAIVALGGAVMVGLHFLSSLVHTDRVAFTANAIILPKPTFHGWTRAEVVLPFDEVMSADVAPFLGTAMRIRIIHKSGPAFILSNWFPDRRDFEPVVALLSSALARRDQGCGPVMGETRPGGPADPLDGPDRPVPPRVRQHQGNQRTIVAALAVCGAIFGAWQFRAQGLAGGAVIGALVYLASFHLQFRWHRPLDWLKVFGGLGVVAGMITGFRQQGLGAALGAAFVVGVVASFVGLLFGTAAWLGWLLIRSVDRAGRRGGAC